MVEIQNETTGQIESFLVVSVGEFEGESVITYVIDRETRQYGTIEIGSTFFVNLT